MYVDFLLAATNICLDPMLIFGLGPFPRLGIVGAALSTDIAYTVAVGAYVVLSLRSADCIAYGFWKHVRVDKELVGRLLRYGLPTGLQMAVELSAFSVFLFLVGRLGTAELAATNLAFNINMLSFIPMMGVGMAVMTLVGKRIGEGRPALAVRTTWLAARVRGDLHARLLHLVRRLPADDPAPVYRLARQQRHGRNPRHGDRALAVRRLLHVFRRDADRVRVRHSRRRRHAIPLLLHAVDLLDRDGPPHLLFHFDGTRRIVRGLERVLGLHLHFGDGLFAPLPPGKVEVDERSSAKPPTSAIQESESWDRPEAASAVRDPPAKRRCATLLRLRLTAVPDRLDHRGSTASAIVTLLQTGAKTIATQKNATITTRRHEPPARAPAWAASVKTGVRPAVSMSCSRSTQVRQPAKCGVSASVDALGATIDPHGKHEQARRAIMEAFDERVPGQNLQVGSIATSSDSSVNSITSSTTA